MAITSAAQSNRNSSANTSGSVIHETAVVDRGAFIGKNVRIWHFCHVMPGAKLGDGTKLGQNVFVDRDVTLGRNVKVQNNVSLYQGVTLEDDVFVGPSAVFTNVRNPRSAFPKKPSEYSRTLIGRGATIGANATIVCGVNVGEQAFIGAGSVVTKDVPAYALVYGAPARRRDWMCGCGEKLPKSGTRKRVSCRRCQSVFSISKSLCKKHETQVGPLPSSRQHPV